MKLLALLIILISIITIACIQIKNIDDCPNGTVKSYEVGNDRQLKIICKNPLGNFGKECRNHVSCRYVETTREQRTINGACTITEAQLADKCKPKPDGYSYGCSKDIIGTCSSQALRDYRGYIIGSNSENEKEALIIYNDPSQYLGIPVPK
ncbi:MAG: hypothetical protein AABX51_05870 [Nanoarchaeota archaeon]